MSDYAGFGLQNIAEFYIALPLSLKILHIMSSKLLLLSILLFFITLYACRSLAPVSAGVFDSYPEYTGADLGMTYGPQRTVFKLWAPSATAVRLHLYAGGESPAPESTVLLEKTASGVWKTTLEGDHTGGPNDQSVFNRIVPGYYYRQKPDGSWSDASACGNETASERPMVRRFMLESLKYWVREYHIDGFRFDLMGIHDITTMNRISAELHAIDPTIFLYGEGWTAGSSPLPDSLRALKSNTMKLDRVAAFSDDMRDAIKGHVFHPGQKGFISGNPDLKESLKFGIVASVQHPQIRYDEVNYSKAPWAREPYQTITYAECHDNHTLWDRLAISAPEVSETEHIRMQKLAGAIVLTSQGVPFLHAGVEMLRSKQGVENSFESPDSINQIDWSRKARYADVFDYFKKLIRLRKDHPAFRMASSEQIRQHLRFIDTEDPNFVAFRLSGHPNGDTWRDILVLYNGSGILQDFTLPDGKWTVVLDAQDINEAGLRTMRSNALQVTPISAMVLVREE